MASNLDPPAIPGPDSMEAGGQVDADADRPAEPVQGATRPIPQPTKDLPSTWAGRLWVGLCMTAVVFVALIVFLLQNTRTTQVTFLWMEGSAPLAVALLIAAVAATLLTLLVGTVRITQLRRRARRRP
jgi:putative membrane protein